MIQLDTSIEARSRDGTCLRGDAPVRQRHYLCHQHQTEAEGLLRRYIGELRARHEARHAAEVAAWRRAPSLPGLRWLLTVYEGQDGAGALGQLSERLIDACAAILEEAYRDGTLPIGVSTRTMDETLLGAFRPDPRGPWLKDGLRRVLAPRLAPDLIGELLATLPVGPAVRQIAERAGNPTPSEEDVQDAASVGLADLAGMLSPGAVALLWLRRDEALFTERWDTPSDAWWALYEDGPEPMRELLDLFAEAALVTRPARTG